MNTERVASSGHDGNALSFMVHEFEGPLDLLLYLIQKAQINVYDIPISDITEQFLGYLDMAKQLDLGDMTDFYAMAAQLVYIKSRMLLPQGDGLSDDEIDDPRQELVERLLEYQKYRKYTELLADSSGEGQLLLSRKKSQFMLPFEDQDLWGEVSVWDLLKTFSSLLKSVSTEQVFNVYEEVTVKQKIALMQELFEDKNEISFLDLVAGQSSSMDVVCAFLAVLEAVKFRLAVVVQHVLFGDILIRKLDNADAFDLEFNDYSGNIMPERDEKSSSELSELSNEDHTKLYGTKNKTPIPHEDVYDEIIILDDDLGEDE